MSVECSLQHIWIYGVEGYYDTSVDAFINLLSKKRPVYSTETCSIYIRRISMLSKPSPAGTKR